MKPSRVLPIVLLLLALAPPTTAQTTPAANTTPAAVTGASTLRSGPARPTPPRSIERWTRGWRMRGNCSRLSSPSTGHERSRNAARVRRHPAGADAVGQQALLSQSVHPDAKLREAAEKHSQKASALGTELSLNRAVFDAIKTLDVAAADAEVFHHVDMLSWTVGVSGAIGKLQFAVGVNRRSGTADDLVVRNILRNDPVRTAVDIHNTGFIYSLAYQF